MTDTTLPETQSPVSGPLTAALLAFFADQAEKDGKVETARRLREQISAPGKSARRKKDNPSANG